MDNIDPNAELLNNELLVLLSIFSEDIFSLEKQLNGVTVVKLVIDVDLADPITINHESTSAIDSKKPKVSNVKLSFLPPVYATIFLSEKYPSESATFKIEASWMYTNLRLKINQHLETINNDYNGCSVIYLYYQFLKDDMPLLIENPLNLDSINKCPKFVKKPRKSSKDEPILISPSQETAHHIHYNKTGSIDRLLESLIDFDQFKQTEKFVNEKFTCQICYCDQYGKDCLQFVPCKHVFCRKCCKVCFEMHIKQGSIDLLRCMSHNCDSTVTPKMIESIVDENMYERYDRLTLTRSLDMMRDVVICPRQNCASFVVKDEQYVNMAECPECNFAFCTLCRRVYHGVAPCILSGTEIEKVLDKYGTGSDEERKALEDKYGKYTLQRLSEEASSTQWKEENCKFCIACTSPIQKALGCNKMYCAKCGNYFCWICMKIINKHNPYSHFNDPESPCFNKLFQGNREDDQDQQDDIFGDSGSDDED